MIKGDTQDFGWNSPLSNDSRQCLNFGAHAFPASGPKTWQPRKTSMAIILATVAPTPLILFCASMFVCYLHFCSHSRGVGLGILTRPWIQWYISIQNCTTNHVMTVHKHSVIREFQYKIVTLNICSREEATHIFRNITTPPLVLELYGCCL